MAENLATIKTPEMDRLAFTVLAIEASAQKMNISPNEMRRRLDKVGLIKNLIQDCYDTLHTESREAVANAPRQSGRLSHVSQSSHGTRTSG